MKAWLFDVDGVITNPELKKANPEIIKKLVEILERGEILGFNTGRALEFVIDEVLKPLEATLTNKNLLYNVFFVGEKGGTWGDFKNGKIENIIDPQITIPGELEQKIRDLISFKYSDTMFFDESKKTMISTELIKGKDLNKFHEEQKSLVEEMKKILEHLNLTNLKIEPSVIATDIQNPHVGKDLGVERFLMLIKGKEEPEEFETFGDSPGDLEMHKYLIKHGHKSRFIYVGTKEIENSENIIKTKAKFDEGTVEYLNSI
ncbi:MAG: hypothetical protein KBD51_03495 [Candidatus Levybacteria bacterium]|nr:hypothetical protein [Candidatus Levybacteria bacterium]